MITQKQTKELAKILGELEKEQNVPCTILKIAQFLKRNNPKFDIHQFIGMIEEEVNRQCI